MPPVPQPTSSTRLAEPAENSGDKQIRERRKQPIDEPLQLDPAARTRTAPVLRLLSIRRTRRLHDLALPLDCIHPAPALYNFKST